MTDNNVGVAGSAENQLLEAHVKRAIIAVLMVALAAAGAMAGAQGEEEDSGPWQPDQPIRLIVPWSAGGGTDTLARALAQHGEKYFGVPVVVENVEGAMGGIGAQRVASGDPDGYELLILSGFVSWIGLVQDYPVSIDDFTPVMNLNRDPAAFAVDIDSDIESLQDLRDYCLANPGEFAVSHSGDGGTWHIAGVSLAQALGVEMNFVPFNGTAPGVAAVMGGNIDGVSGGAAEFVSQARGNELRVLAVLSEDTFGPLPNVPTAHDAGFDLEFYTTRGLVAPDGLPAERAQVLYEGFAQIMQEPDFVETMGNIGLGIYALPPDEYGEFLTGLVSQATDSLRMVGMLE